MNQLPGAELTCQFICDNNNNSSSSSSNNIKNNDKNDNTNKKSINNESDNDNRHVRIPDDSLLVDQSIESLQDVPIAESDTTTYCTDVTVALAPEVIPELESEELQVGDHVYQWRSLCGLPYAFQHHGIVMDIIDDEEGKPVRLTIADFSNVEPNNVKKKKTTINKKKQQQQQQQKIQQQDAKQSIESTRITKSSTEIEETILVDNPLLRQQQQQDEKIIQRRQQSSSRSSSSTSLLSLEQEGILSVYTDTDKWHKVQYQASWWKCQVYRSGTATNSKSDPVGIVLARVSFIMQHPEQLPDYHVVHANCECVAFWCKTGKWSTLQASSFLELTAAGQMKSTATLAATAAGTTANVTVPAAGIWGWFGLTTTQSVSWLSLHPMAIPGLACYAAVTVGVPAIMYATAHKKWKETSQRLCDAFWESATENPEVFAECITHWSDRGR